MNAIINPAEASPAIAPEDLNAAINLRLALLGLPLAVGADGASSVSYTHLDVYKRQDLAYLHVMRSDFFQQQSGDVMTPVRAHYRGVLIGNMGYTGEEAGKAIAEGKVDAIAFGTGFLANPDLPARFKAGAPLNTPDPDTFYTPGPAGYTDYPVFSS